jgi:tetratricopeptide (TPR) repeat protein
MHSSAATVLPARYAAPRRIAVGGMGEIYLAQDSLLRRPVALKLLAERFARDRTLRRRFLGEANAAAQVSGHPNVVTIYDVGECEGRPFIAMEYLPNGDLRRRLRQGRPALATSLQWIAETASALDAAHDRGIVHRDVKPANLLLDDRCSVRVADFGIARVVDATTTSMTLPGTILGTAGYISPEQARGDPATAASDAYSLAAVAYELLTGKRPFERASDTDEIAAHLHAPLPPASSAFGVPNAVDPVFDRAMAKDSHSRYPTGEAFSSALIEALQSSIVVAPAARDGEHIRTYRGRAPHPRPLTRALLVVGMALAAALVGLAAADRLSTGGGAPASAARTITRQRTIERVVTRQGTTVTVPQTQTNTDTDTLSVPTTAPPNAAIGHQLNDQGYAAMQRQDYAAALAPLRRAVHDLSGAGPTDPYEAYANYNLGYTLLQLGDCQEAITPLGRAQRLESSPAVPAALNRARACDQADRSG